MIARLVATALAVLTFAELSTAQSDQEVRGELTEVRARIEKIQVRLVKERSAESEAASQLAERETRIGALASSVQDLTTKIAEAETRLAKLDDEQRRISSALTRQRQDLARTARLVWLSGRRGEVQQLLDADSPDEAGRGLAYQSYFRRAGTSRLQQLSEELGEAVRLVREIARQRAEFAVLQGNYSAELEELEVERAKRKKILDDATRLAAQSSDELKTLTRDAQRLEKLLDELREALADIPEDPDRDAPFNTRKGALSWPVSGKVAARFGTTRTGGQRWKGLLIEAPRGEKVLAVSSGRVAFAEWLRGFGLLTIIDHGGGYLTLYGFNESLYKEAGDWVSSGDTIASVGASGGRRVPGLYFELRRKGKPINPTGWLKAL